MQCCAIANEHVAQKSTTVSYLPTTVFIKKTVSRHLLHYMEWSEATVLRKKTVAASVLGSLQMASPVVSMLSTIASLQETVVLRKKTVSGKTLFVSSEAYNIMFISIINPEIIKKNYNPKNHQKSKNAFNLRHT